jgi:hypothetical protein
MARKIDKAFIVIKSAGRLQGSPSPKACVMLHGQENYKMCKKKKISRSPAKVNKPNSLCHVAWPGKLLYVKKISRSPAGVTKPNSLCHVAWPGKLLYVKKISRSPAGVTKPNIVCHVAWPGKFLKKEQQVACGSHKAQQPASCCMNRNL